MDVKLGMVEARFADIIWENEPLSTKDLVAICAKELDWKRTTTYTVLKRLCDKGSVSI
jgi:predicted transcriptional regulator